LANDAIGLVNRPCSCSCAIRKQYSCIPVISASISASFACTSWKLAMGRPNCVRVFAYDNAIS
jgi:hypothetical protein